MNQVAYSSENQLNQSETSCSPSALTIPLALSKKRYLILLLFCLCSMSNAFQWIEYAIITDKIAMYYSISNFSVNLTSIIYMVIYIPGIFPASWILVKKGLRSTILLGSFGTFFGSFIKCFSIEPTMFWLTMIGQSIVAVSQLFIINLPSRLSAVWFGKDEVGLATTLGVFGNQLGVTLGFFLPPFIVSATYGSSDLPEQLKMLTYGLAIITLIIFVLISLLFENGPQVPPSESQAKASLVQKKFNHFDSVKYLITNKNTNFLITSYGINVGVFYALSTTLNQLMASSFPSHISKAGDIGAILTVSGTLGSFFCGLILSKFPKYKFIITLIYSFSLLGVVAFLFSLIYDLKMTYLVSGFLGFFMTGYLAIGLDFAAEICYPYSEGTSAGLLNASAQFFGIILTFMASYLVDHYNHIIPNILFICILTIGLIMSCLIKSELKRRQAMTEEIYQS